LPLDAVKVTLLKRVVVYTELAQLFMVIEVDAEAWGCVQCTSLTAHTVTTRSTSRAVSLL